MKDKRAKRFNKGKLRYELMPQFATEKVVEVYTRGAHKYSVYEDGEGNKFKGSEIPFEDLAEKNLTLIEDGANNWRLGQDWMSSMASIKRHIAAWESGVDIDPDPSMKTLHLANAAWGLLSLIEFYKIHPSGDNRPHSYYNQPKIGLDIDEVLADFVGGVMEKFPDMKERSVYWNDFWISDNFKEIAGDKSFWKNLKPKTTDLPFEPHCYITSRPVPSELTEAWLRGNGFPSAPVFTVGHGKSKVEIAKESGIDIFVDDSFTNFVDLNKAGICTYLMDAPHNQRYDVGFKRIFDLKEIL